MSTLDTWRSLLYVPGHREDFLAKVHQRKADAVIVDLEDGVPPAEKDRARERLPDSVKHIVNAGTPVAVRINSSWRLTWEDLAALTAAPVSAVLLPKLESVERARVVVEMLDELDAGNREIPIVGLIETARGLHGAAAIFAAVPRIRAVIPGNQDLALDLGIAPNAASMERVMVSLILSARTHSVQMLGTMGGSADIEDLKGFRDRVARARTWGFVGATCIHPNQVEVVHEVYRVSDNERRAAQRIVEAFEASQGGAIRVDGHMVDRPVYLRARRLLEQDIP